MFGFMKIAFETNIFDFPDLSQLQDTSAIHYSDPSISSQEVSITNISDQGLLQDKGTHHLYL